MLSKDAKEVKFCILGAGHGGLAMAGQIALASNNIQECFEDVDVLMSLVPLASIGKMLKVQTPTIMRGKDFWAEGITADSLGIRNISVKEIRLLAVAGVI